MARGRPSKRQLIIDTATVLFCELGYQGTSIDQVVIKAGVSKPTVYSNFATKQVLWCAVMEDVLVSTQHTANDLSPATVDWPSSWLAIWQEWLASPMRVAIYRIMLGESHKMEVQATRCFQQLEQLLEHRLQRCWHQHGLYLSFNAQAAIIACSQQQLLMPLLRRQTIDANLPRLRALLPLLTALPD
jgi:AcrR family transcriptional regulator